MKAYLITTGLLFGVLVVLHVWRIAAEWTRAASQTGFVLEMSVGIVLPGILCWWAFWLLRRLRQL
jgi:tetrahydromethanopterin S-methyltransferase subunit E